jgi:hypothetical protein
MKNATLHTYSPETRHGARKPQGNKLRDTQPFCIVFAIFHRSGISTRQQLAAKPTFSSLVPPESTLIHHNISHRVSMANCYSKCDQSFTVAYISSHRTTEHVLPKAGITTCGSPRVFRQVILRIVDLGSLRVRIREEMLVFTAADCWRLEFASLPHREARNVRFARRFWFHEVVAIFGFGLEMWIGGRPWRVVHFYTYYVSVFFCACIIRSLARCSCYCSSEARSTVI